MSLVDPAILISVCGDDGDLFAPLCQDFHTFVPARIAEISEALREEDGCRLRHAAHKLCGLLSAFSTKVAAVASDLEDCAAGGRLDDARPLVERLESMSQKLLHEVNGLSLEELRAKRAPAP